MPATPTRNKRLHRHFFGVGAAAGGVKLTRREKRRKKEKKREKKEKKEREEREEEKEEKKEKKKEKKKERKGEGKGKWKGEAWGRERGGKRVDGGGDEEKWKMELNGISNQGRDPHQRCGLKPRSAGECLVDLAILHAAGLRGTNARLMAVPEPIPYQAPCPRKLRMRLPPT